MYTFFKKPEISYVIGISGCDIVSTNSSSPRSLRTDDMAQRFFRPARSRSADVAELRQAEGDKAGWKKI
jgi:hypothetical protein